MNILFFGSTTDSVIILDKLFTTHYSLFTPRITAIVTQPPRPVGRKQLMTPTPVETWAKTRAITVLSFPSNTAKPWLYLDEAQVVDALEPLKADLIVSASYGQKIPAKTLKDAKFGGLNVHPSLLPRWRGGDPVPWAIMTGDHQTGVTIVSLSEKFDAGIIYAQKKIPITGTDTSRALRTKLFELGANLLADLLPLYITGKAKGKPQTLSQTVSSQAHSSGRGKSARFKPVQPGGLIRFKPLPVPENDEPRARRLSRDTGYEPWDTILKALSNETEATRIERKYRALNPWPGVWTLLRQDFGGQAEKRLKILKLHLDNGLLAIDEVQLEGKNPVSWQQFSQAYLPPISS